MEIESDKGKGAHAGLSGAALERGKMERWQQDTTAVSSQPNRQDVSGHGGGAEEGGPRSSFQREIRKLCDESALCREVRRDLQAGDSFQSF